MRESFGDPYAQTLPSVLIDTVEDVKWIAVMCSVMHEIIARVTFGCNMSCIFCYDDDKRVPDIMDLETPQLIIEKLAKFNSDFGGSAIIWHRGEASLANFNLYHEIIKFQKFFNCHKFKNYIQTNGTLLTHNNLDFFENNHFKLSVSLDGLEDTHKQNRPYMNGLVSSRDVYMEMLN